MPSSWTARTASTSRPGRRTPASSSSTRPARSWRRGPRTSRSRVGYDPNQYAATAHGLYWSKEGDQEFLYWTENVAAPKGKPKLGARVYKTDLDGKILYQIGNVDKETETSQKFDFTNPTDVAVAANGDIYVVDGYGSQLVHRFDKNFKLIKTMGGPGKEHGKFNTCHGIWVNTLKKEPEIYIADRANDRVEVYSLDLEYKRTIRGVRKPCCFYQHDGQLYVPDLDARVTILDADDKVVAHLGDGLELRNKTGRPGQAPGGVRHPARPDRGLEGQPVRDRVAARPAGPRKLAGGA